MIPHRPKGIQERVLFSGPGRPLSWSLHGLAFGETMPLRLIQVLLPADSAESMEAVLDGLEILDWWTTPLPGERLEVDILAASEEVEAVMDKLEGRFSVLEKWRLILKPVDATLPRPKEPPKEDKKEEGKGEPQAAPGEEEKKAKKTGRVNREELYATVRDGIGSPLSYSVMILLSAIVAAFGLTHDDVAVIIGAMVIAPLLGPNMALALATTLGDRDLAKKALHANLLGIGLAAVLSLAVGFFFRPDPSIHAMAARTSPQLDSLLLALASGTAGAFALTGGGANTLIGVMVAVALMPPLVTFGMLLGANHPKPALGALLLFLANLISVNLAGVATFLARGVHPRSWWEAEKARKASRRAVILWVLLLLALAAVLYLAGS